MADRIVHYLEDMIRSLTGGGEPAFVLLAILAVAMAAGSLPALFFDRTWNGHRRWIRIRILSRLAWAVERDLPLDPLLVAFETEAWHGIKGFRFLGWRRVVTAIRERLAAGALLGDACSPHALLFGPHRLARLREAEKAGRLAHALRAEVGQLRDLERSRSALKETLTYPVYLVWLATTALMLVMVGFATAIWIFPTFKKVMEDLGLRGTSLLDLPQSIFGPSGTGTRFAILLALLGAGVVVLRLRRRETLGGWLFHLPLAGTPLRLLAARDLCETLAALWGPGVPLPDAFRAVSGCARFRPVRRLAGRLADGVARGGDPAFLVARERLLPVAVREMLALGFRAGDPAAACRRAADHLAGLIEFRLRTLRVVVAAALIAGAGLLVGLLAAAVFGSIARIEMHILTGAW